MHPSPRSAWQEPGKRAPPALTRVAGTWPPRPVPSQGPSQGPSLRPLRGHWPHVTSSEGQHGRGEADRNGSASVWLWGAGEVYAVSNKCTHLGLPLQGKIVGQEVVDGCVVCPFHNNAFDIKTGEVQGEWAPGFPKLPLVGKIKETAPLPTYATRVDGDSVEVDV